MLGERYYVTFALWHRAVRLSSVKSIKFKLYIYTAPIKVRLLTGASYKYARSNKTVFNNRLNCSREVSSLFKLSGRLFHTVGAETRKLLGPKRTVRVREIISSQWSADRSRARAGTEWTGVQMPSKYAGHLPWMQSVCNVHAPCSAV